MKPTTFPDSPHFNEWNRFVEKLRIPPSKQNRGWITVKVDWNDFYFIGKEEFEEETNRRNEKSNPYLAFLYSKEYHAMMKFPFKKPFGFYECWAGLVWEKFILLPITIVPFNYGDEDHFGTEPPIQVFAYMDLKGQLLSKFALEDSLYYKDILNLIKTRQCPFD